MVTDSDLRLTHADCLPRRPFWISPRQAIVVPVAAPHKDYAQEVMQKLWDAGIWSEVDLTDATLNKKIVSGYSTLRAHTTLTPSCSGMRS